MSATYAEANGATQPLTTPGGRFCPGTDEDDAVFLGLVTDPQFASAYGIDACGHCGAAFTGADAGLFCWERPLERLRHLAYQAGWDYDSRRIWTCPACQQDPAWLSLHRTLAVPGGPAGAAALAMDVMLTSHDYPDVLRAYDRHAGAILAPHRDGDPEFAWDPGRWPARFGHSDPAPGRHRSGRYRLTLARKRPAA